MGTIAAHTGDEMIGFFPGSEPFALSDYPHLPVIFSCVIPRHRGRTLYVFNIWRKGWELPTGFIEPNETPHDAAVRELYEESGQVASELTFAGMCLIRLKHGGLELGTIYSCILKSLHPVQMDAEVSQVMLWDGVEPVTGYIDEISQELCKLVSIG
jgi:8-oxo-dGTP diphosphatase